MKKITLLLLLVVTSFYGYSQCLRTSKWPTADASANNDGLKHDIISNNRTDDFSVLIGLTIGDNYSFEIVHGVSMDNKYITVRDNANATTVLAEGFSPLTINNITVAGVQLHFSDDATCGPRLANDNHASSYTNLSTLGVDDLELAEEFKIFPNPVNDELTISTKTEIKKLVIVNALGQAIKTVTPNSSNYKLDFSDLKSGLYFVKATVNTLESTFKIVKR